MVPVTDWGQSASDPRNQDTDESYCVDFFNFQDQIWNLQYVSQKSPIVIN